MKKIETTGRIAEEAIEIALKELGVDRADVEIDVISEGKPGGFFGIGSEPARVRVAIVEKPSDVVTVALEVLDRLISEMGVSAVINLKHAFKEEVGGPVFDIVGDDSGLLIGRRGETLRALQFVASLLTSRRVESKSRIFVDVSGYQERRYEALTNMAQKVAQRVNASGYAVTLEPMPPNERRIVHLALAEHPKVETASTGEGEGRQVVVEPRKG